MSTQEKHRSQANKPRFESSHISVNHLLTQKYFFISRGLQQVPNILEQTMKTNFSFSRVS